MDQFRGVRLRLCASRRDRRRRGPPRRPRGAREVQEVAWCRRHAENRRGQSVRLQADDHSIIIEKGNGHLSDRWQYDTYDTAIAVIVEEQSWAPFSISLYDSEQRHLIGEFLNHDDCEQLITQLKDLGLYVRTSGRQQIVDF